MDNMENQEVNPVAPEINEEPASPIAEESENQPVDQPIEPVAEQEATAGASEPETTENAEPEPVEQPSISVETVMAMFDELNRKFDGKIAQDAHKNTLFDKMYAELNSYKNDLYQKILKPFVMDAIMLIDDTNKLIRDMDKTDAEKIFKALSGIPDDLLEILERNGIEAFEEESDTFNPKTQRALKTIPTNNPELDNKIESRVRQGYRWDEKIIKPEMVQCYKYSN